MLQTPSDVEFERPSGPKPLDMLNMLNLVGGFRNHGNNENHGNPGGKPRVPQTMGLEMPDFLRPFEDFLRVSMGPKDYTVAVRGSQGHYTQECWM